MSRVVDWQLAGFAALALAIAIGVAWYERSRPSSRVVAAVAMLAALAVVGRVAFAAVPSVKPTTDVIVLTGYSLGGAPGFMVGATTALVSNFYFGQGPWTAWQMVAWGGAGAGGALLARVTSRRAGRYTLALWCAFTGLAFGAFMNLGTVVGYAGSDVSGGFVAVLVQALPFDIAHAVGNFVFCLAFGPGLVRVLHRMRERSTVIWPAAPRRAPPPSDSRARARG